MAPEIRGRPPGDPVSVLSLCGEFLELSALLWNDGHNFRRSLDVHSFSLRSGGDVLAMKQMRKIDMQYKNQRENAREEARALARR